MSPLSEPETMGDIGLPFFQCITVCQLWQNTTNGHQREKGCVKVRRISVEMIGWLI